MSRSLRGRFLPGLAAFSLFIGVGSAVAAAPQFDSGLSVAELEKPYKSAQSLGNIYESKSVYGKLADSTSVDIYSFKADKDGEQTFSLLAAPKPADAAATQGQERGPYLFILDPTTATEAEQINLPLPTEDYHVAIISAQTDKVHFEPGVLLSYDVAAQQKLQLKKDITYYFVVVDQYGRPFDYVIKTGEGTTWTAKDVVTHPIDWFKVRFNSYAGSNPFGFGLNTGVLIALLLGLSILVGTFVIESILSFLANKLKSAGYLLVKLQPISRVLYWVSLWLAAIAGYLYMSRLSGFVGVSFALILVFLVLVVSLAVHTFALSPRIMKLEVTSREATVPFALRKRLFFSFLVTLFSLGATIAFLAMILTK